MRDMLKAASNLIIDGTQANESGIDYNWAHFKMHTPTFVCGAGK